MRKPRILFLCKQNNAIGYYRSWVPARILHRQNFKVEWKEHWNWNRGPRPQQLKWLEERVGKFDLVFTDRTWQHEDLGWVRGLVHHSPGCRLVTDFDDDWTCVPEYNPAHSKYHVGMEGYETSFHALRLAEMATCSTKVLYDRYDRRAHHLMLVPNHLDLPDWEHPVDPTRKDDPCLRVVYGGALGHSGDTDTLQSTITRLIENPPVPLRLFVFGPMARWMYDLGDAHPGRIIPMDLVQIESYPKVMAWGGFDLAIAPLLDNPFNRSKSNIKWQEAAAQRIPLICSNVGPYSDLEAGTAIRCDDNDWDDALWAVLTDPDYRSRIREAAYESVQSQLASAPAAKQLWYNVVEAAMARPRIETLEDTRLPE